MKNIDDLEKRVWDEIARLESLAEEVRTEDQLNRMFALDSFMQREYLSSAIYDGLRLIGELRCWSEGMKV